jgi:signal transduction histidine kinase
MHSKIKYECTFLCAGELLFIAVVVLGYASALWTRDIDWSAMRGIACIGLGAIHIFLSLIYAEQFRKPKPWPPRPAYLMVQACILTGILLAGRFADELYLCACPFVAQCVIMLSPPAAIFSVATFFGIFVAVLSRFVSKGQFVHETFAGFSAFVFVFIFTRIAVQEKEARAETERLSAEIKEANRKLRDQAAHIAKLAVLEERNRLARELHDSLGHYLTTVSVQLEAAQAVRGTDPDRAWEVVSKAHGLSRDALIEVRRSVGSLRVEKTNGSLVERLRKLTATAEGIGPTMGFEVLGQPRQLAPEMEHGLFRAAQEGSTNVRKHAAARHSTIIIDYRNASRVTVRVVDDGRGAVRLNDGHGLAGLRERISLFGGAVVAGGRPEGGFQLQVEIPA